MLLTILSLSVSRDCTIYLLWRCYQWLGAGCQKHAVKLERPYKFSLPAFVTLLLHTDKPTALLLTDIRINHDLLWSSLGDNFSPATTGHKSQNVLVISPFLCCAHSPLVTTCSDSWSLFLTFFIFTPHHTVTRIIEPISFCFLPWIYNCAVTPGDVWRSFISGRWRCGHIHLVIKSPAWETTTKLQKLMITGAIFNFMSDVLSPQFGRICCLMSGMSWAFSKIHGLL